MAWDRIGPGVWVGQAYVSRGDESWYVIRRRESGGFTRKRQSSRAVAVAVARKVLELESSGPRELTVAEVCEAYLEHMAQGRPVPSLPSMRGYVKHWIAPTIGHVAIDKLDRGALWQLVHRIIEEAGKSPSLTRAALTTIRSAVNLLTDGEILAEWAPPRGFRSPSRRISKTITEMERTYGKNVRDRSAYTAAEVVVLLEEAAKLEPPIFSVLLLAVSTGMRLSELASLPWADVDLEHGAVTLRMQRTKAAKPRVVFLTRRATAELRRLRSSARTGNVFESGGQTIDKHWIAWRWKLTRRAACERTVRDGSIERRVRFATFHEFRHTFVSNAVLAGASESQLRAHVGHGSDELLRNYTHLDERARLELEWVEGLVGEAGAVELPDGVTLQ